MPSAPPAALTDRVRAAIRDIPDFPQPGILFKDITPVLADGPLFSAVVGRLADRFAGQGIEAVVGIESRGFIFAAPIADRLGCGFVPARKPGKLPHRTVRVDYALEYGTDALEAHADAIRQGQRVLIIDDVLATGGTAAAAVRLVERLGGEIVGVGFVVELALPGARDRLAGLPIEVVVGYAGG